MAHYVDIDKFREEAFYADTEADIASYIGKHGYADVEEVKHGHWKQNTHFISQYSCSLCGRSVEDERLEPEKCFPYCHCGAKMDGNGNSDCKTRRTS